MMLSKTSVILLFLSVPFIGFLDYCVFYKHIRCMNCNKMMGDWRQFILPTFIEFSFFIIGLYLGSL